MGIALCICGTLGKGTLHTHPSFRVPTGVVNISHFVCVAANLCWSVGNQTSMMSLCINCNWSTHHFCAKYLSEQPPVEESLVIVIKVRDFSKEGKVCYKEYKKIHTAKKCNVMFCILCKFWWKAITVSAAAKIVAIAVAKIAAKTSKKNLNKFSREPIIHWRHLFIVWLIPTPSVKQIVRANIFH